MLGRVVVDRARIEAEVARLAGEIEETLDRAPEGEPPVFVGVLKGCVYFLTDLTSRIRAPLEVDFIQASSYGAGTTSSGSVVLVKDLTADVRDRDVFLVEDIVDTGTTLADLVGLVKARHPRSVRIVSLLSKPSRRTTPVTIDFLGLEVDDLFVVGYGLDYAERYRNLPEIHELLEDDRARAEEEAAPSSA